MSEVNKTYNELTIKKYISKPKEVNKYQSWNSSTWVKCQCSCGNYIDLPLNAVQKGYIKSCGHLRVQNAVARLEECRDSTHNAIYLTYDNKTLNIAEWSKETGIPRTTIMYRVSKNMPIEKILERIDSREEKNTACS